MVERAELARTASARRPRRAARARASSRSASARNATQAPWSVKRKSSTGGPERGGARRLRRPRAAWPSTSCAKRRDLLRRAVAHPQRLDLGAVDAELGEEAAPRGEAGVREQVLLRVAREREAAPLVEAVDQHPHLERREVLHLVDRDVAVAQRLRWRRAAGPTRSCQARSSSASSSGSSSRLARASPSSHAKSSSLRRRQ